MAQEHSTKSWRSVRGQRPLNERLVAGYDELMDLEQRREAQSEERPEGPGGESTPWMEEAEEEE